jgi:hypothetical protein
MNKDDCIGCRHHDRCSSPCLYLETVYRLSSKPKPLRELLKPPDGEPERDYKQVLIDHQQARQQALTITIKEIRDVPDIRLRLIAAALYADISVNDISRYLSGKFSLDASNIYKLIKNLQR